LEGGVVASERARIGIQARCLVASGKPLQRFPSAIGRGCSAACFSWGPRHRRRSRAVGRPRQTFEGFEQLGANEIGRGCPAARSSSGPRRSRRPREVARATRPPPTENARMRIQTRTPAPCEQPPRLAARTLLPGALLSTTPFLPARQTTYPDSPPPNPHKRTPHLPSRTSITRLPTACSRALIPRPARPRNDPRGSSDGTDPSPRAPDSPSEPPAVVLSRHRRRFWPPVAQIRENVTKRPRRRLPRLLPASPLRRNRAFLCTLIPHNGARSHRMRSHPASSQRADRRNSP
jgi:hypothetical protein